MTEIPTAPSRTSRKNEGGLTVQRIFTREGVHPYDEIDWERRDIIQTNWKTGEVIFNQKGVEFPANWSLNACTVVATKYFRGAHGTPEREWSLKQLVDRVVDKYVETGIEFGYFATDKDAEIFGHELKWMLVNQYFSFNSPVWFNVGTNAPQYVSACFILSVDDTMDSILNWYREEGLIFKGGSGAGVNLSRIRSSKELLRSSGGSASGPVSFMRGADASAGTIKSGGATRRAAKMIVLDVDHPDIEEFIETKVREEDKIRVLRDAGFDMDLGGKDISSVQYQNANNSVRVTDEFMHAVENGDEFALRGRVHGEVVETVDARSLFTKIAEAAWACADPGVQYDDTINDWHTNPETGRITASNPCFTGDTRVHTDKGLIRFRELFERANAGEQFQVYTHDATNPDAPSHELQLTTPKAFLITGHNDIVRLRFSGGQEIRCTPGHRFWTTNRGYVEAENLTADDRLLPLDLAAPAVNADWSIADAVHAAGVRKPYESTDGMSFPGEWSFELAHYLGWLIGDGSTSSTISTIYGSAEDRTEILPLHQELLEGINGGRPIKVSEQANGTAQLRLARASFRRFLEALGVTSATSTEKSVPDRIFEAPEPIVAAFLRGLFDADGTAVLNQEKGSYIGLGSSSPRLLREVQMLLGSLGIVSSIYHTRAATENGYKHKNADGSVTEYAQSAAYQLRITRKYLDRFMSSVGFELSRKSELGQSIVASRTPYNTDFTVSLVERSEEGIELTYNLSEPRNHSYVANGIVVRNCSEYLSLDNSSCNLASLNLLRYMRDDNTFDVEAFTKSVELIITAMDISICFADFPTDPIGDTTRDYRQLGIGYANLGALLMTLGLPYDSDKGRALAAAITALMTGTGYRRSAELAGIVGPYNGFARNARAHERVMKMHAAAVEGIDPATEMTAELSAAAQREWDACLEIGARNGWRNAQCSVLAPTGCLTGSTLVTSDFGLLRMSEIGDVWGDRWQDINMSVSTDEGPRSATKFFVNGEEPTRIITTANGYRIQGTLAHRVKIVNSTTGEWEWKRFSDIGEGDLLPIQIGGMVGDAREIALPVLGENGHPRPTSVQVPSAMTEDLAEFVGYFMGGGSLHSKGLRLCVANTDLDVVSRLGVLVKELFNVETVTTEESGFVAVYVNSTQLARWWDAAGFAKKRPSDSHSGKGWVPHVPYLIRATNDPLIYGAFIRGLFEADGTVSGSVPSFSTASPSFAEDVRSVLLALGIVTTSRITPSGFGGDIVNLRLRNISYAKKFMSVAGFISGRKAAAVSANPKESGNRDLVHLPRHVWESLCPVGHPLRSSIISALSKSDGGVSRDLATRLADENPDPALVHALDYTFETVRSNVDGGVQPTYDLSVPENVTYVANGFVSHNTIGLAMDCDTTGVEPDFSLLKFKKLVGGGSMQIVNAQVARALETLGYQQESIEAIEAYIAEHGHVVDAPGLAAEHYGVFDCAVGERAISPMGHIKMMAAVQPFISGAISKTVNMPESATVQDIADIYTEGWRLGLKALAIYRDGSKVGQPLSAAKSSEADEDAEVDSATESAVVVPKRTRLPRKRRGSTISFEVQGNEGYLSTGEYEDGHLGEVFVKMSKQGSTLAGLIDAFSIAVSIGLQYGVPLETYVEKFIGTRFEPAGITDDPDVRMAQSVVDYIFRRLALDYLDPESRSAFGIMTAAERIAALDATYGAPEVASHAGSAPAADVAEVATDAAPPAPVPVPPAPVSEAPSSRTPKVDAPMCSSCGTSAAMRRSGACWVCGECGTTTGCS